MASKGTIGAKIVLEGEKEYRQAIKQINTQQKELKSEMKLLQTEFKNQQNSIDALTKKQQVLAKQYESQKQKVDTYKTALSAASDAEQKAATKVQDLQTQYDLARKKMDEMAKATDTTEQEMLDQEKAVESLAKGLATAQEDYTKISDKVMQYQTSLNLAEADLKNMDDELQKNTKYLTEAEHSADGLADSIDEFGNEVDNTKEKTSTFGDVLKANLTSEVIIAGVKAIADGIREIATAAIETGMQFEASMSQVAATMGMTSEEIANGSAEYNKLADAAKKMGAETMFSASQAGDALNYLALAGYDADKAVETLPKVLTLAAAGGMELAYASDLVTDSMSALGMETSEIDGYIDQMAKASQKSNTSVSQLGEATLVCAGAVAQVNMPLEVMNTALGVLANNGLKGAEGGTHLRNVILSLTAPTDKAAATLEGLGIAVADSEGDMRDLEDILMDLNSALSEMGDVEKAATLKRIFNKTDIGAVNALLKSTTGEFDDLKQKIIDSNGAAQDMADTMMDNLKGKLTILDSSLEGLGITVSEVFDDTLKDAVDAASSAVSDFNKSLSSGDMKASLEKISKALDQFMQSAIQTGESALPKLIDGLAWILENAREIGDIIATVGGAFAAYKTGAVLVEGVTFAMDLLKDATTWAALAQDGLNAAMMANPFGVVLAGATLLIGALTLLGDATNEYGKLLGDEVKSTDELASASRDLEESLKESKDAYDENAESIEKNSSKAKGLVSRLSELADQESRTAEESQEMQRIIDELNVLYPNLGLKIDENTGKLNKNTTEITQNIEALTKQARAQAAQERITEIINERIKAEDALAEAEETRVKVEEELNKATDRVNEEVEKYNNNLGGMGENLDTAVIMQQTFADQLSATDDAIATAKEAIASCDEEYERLTQTINENSQAIEESGVPALESVDDSLIELVDAYYEAKDAAYESISSQVGLFEEMEKVATVAAGNMATALDTQAEAFTTYSENLEYATSYAKTHTDKNYKEILSSIESLGLDGAGYLQGLVDATKARSDDFDTLMASWADMQEAKDNLASTMAEFETGISTGMDNSSEIVEKAMDDITEITEDGFDDIVDANEDGMDDIQDSTQKGMDGMVKIINQTTSNATSAAAQLATSVTSAVKERIGRDTFVKIGSDIGGGLAEGIRSSTADAVKAAQDMAKAVETASKTQLKIHSPSRVFREIGEFVGMGFEEGIKASFEDVNKTVNSVMNNVIEDASNVNAVGSATPVSSASSGILALLNEYLPEIAENQTDVSVRLEGNASNLFDMVRQQARVFKKSTGASAF